MATFLFKTEPSEYSFDDLVRGKKAEWSGVSNPAALGFLRSVRKGDEILVYHTGDERAIVGLAKSVSAVREDAKKPGKTPGGEPKFAVLDIAPVKRAKTAVTLAELKGDKRFGEFLLVRRGRLSVMPVPEELDGILRKMAGL